MSHPTKDDTKIIAGEHRRHQAGGSILHYAFKHAERSRIPVGAGLTK
jgi:hypothetical protein